MLSCATHLFRQVAERSTPINFSIFVDAFRALPQRPVPQPRSRQQGKDFPKPAIFAAMTFQDVDTSQSLCRRKHEHSLRQVVL